MRAKAARENLYDIDLSDSAWFEDEKQMERITTFLPAFDKRNDDPAKNYGVHGVELLMVLKGDFGATQFMLYTNWQLPHITQEYLTQPAFDQISVKVKWCPMPADFGYHSPTPLYDGQTPIHDGEPCPYLNDKPCYYDGSTLNAQGLYDTLLTEGSDGVWKKLEERYIEIFGELK